MTSSNVIGVPIPNPNRPFTIFRIEQLYTGPLGHGQEVPNIDDLIVDYSLGIFRRCIAVDYTNFTWALETFNPVQVYNETATIGGMAPSVSDTYRIYIDTTKHPYTMRIDGRLEVGGSDLTCVKVFRGSDYSAAGTVISAYIKNGVLISESIPLELVKTEMYANKAVKVAVAGSCKQTVDNGERLTVVVYSDVDEVAVVAVCNAVVTNMAMASTSPAKQILDVRLKSPFLAPGDDKLLQLYINMPLDDMQITGEIVYNDGTVPITIDGTRMRLDGLRNSGAQDTYYISSQAGQEIDLLLTYRIGSNETYIGSDVIDGVICRPYRATTLPVDGAYSLKMFVVPTWQDSARGYKLRYFIYDLDRGNVFEATSYVTLAVNSAAFDPILYGVKQHLAMCVDVGKVSNFYKSHIHPQSFAITLMGPATDKVDNFRIEYTPTKPQYGEGVYAKFHYDNVTYWMLDIRCGCASKAEWLAKLYDKVYPLYDPRSEAAPPVPTHMEIVTRTKSYLLTVDQWVSPFHVDYQLIEGETVMIKWIRRTGAESLQLGMSPLIAHQMT